MSSPFSVLPKRELAQIRYKCDPALPPVIPPSISLDEDHFSESGDQMALDVSKTAGEDRQSTA
jgi:hypothetical protein